MCRKLRGNQQYGNDFRWVSQNVLLLRFSIKTIHKHNITTDAVRWILFDIAIGNDVLSILSKLGSQTEFIYAPSTTAVVLDFGYDTNSKDLRIVQRLRNVVEIATINTNSVYY